MSPALNLTSTPYGPSFIQSPQSLATFVPGSGPFSHLIASADQTVSLRGAALPPAASAHPAAANKSPAVMMIALDLFMALPLGVVCLDFEREAFRARKRGVSSTAYSRGRSE